MGKVFFFKKIPALFCAILFIFVFFALYSFSAKPILSAYSKDVKLYTAYGSFGVGKDYSGGALVKSRIKGESCRLYGVSYDKILKDFSAKHVFTEETAFGTSFYAFSPKISYRTRIGGKIVNLQYFIAGDGGKMLGTPIIFGGY